MKTFKHLYETCTNEAVLRYVVKQVKKSKRIRKIVERRHLSDDELRLIAEEQLADFHNFEHTPKIIKDGVSQKERSIIVPTIEELLVQHAVCVALQLLLSLAEEHIKAAR